MTLAPGSLTSHFKQLLAFVPILTIFSSKLALAGWVTTLSPAFQPSIPSTSGNSVYYYYVFIAEAAGEASPCGQVWTTLEGYTEESGNTISTRGTASFSSNNRRPGGCSVSESSNSGAASYPDSAYTTIKNGVSYPGTPSTQNLSGSGYSGTLTTGSVWFQYNDEGCCGYGIEYAAGTSIYYELEIWLDQGATPPSLSSVGTGSASNETKPIVTVSKLGDAKEANPLTNGGLRVSRTGSTSSSLTVYFSLGGSAAGPSPSMDYYLSGSSGTSVTISAGNSYADITVIPNYDGYADNHETVILTLSSNSNYAIGSPSSATVYIDD